MPARSTQIRNAVASARKTAEAAGFYIREGSYVGAGDDRLGRWYVADETANFFRPWGAGYRTKGEAWLAAAEQAADYADLMAI